MTNTILVKNSGTTTSVPVSMTHGELALNYADGKLFYKNVSNTIVGAKLITGITGTSEQVTVTETSGSFAISLPSTVKLTTLFIDNIEVDTTGATSGQSLVYNGTKFAPSRVSTQISDGPPASPSAGELWYESDTGRS